MRDKMEQTAADLVRSNKVSAVPEVVWAPLAAGILTLVPGLIALATGYPLLFPSLAPTAFLQAAQPQQPTARLYYTLVGHLIGVVAAFACVLLLHASVEPPIFVAHHLYPLRLWASALAVAVTLLVQVPTKALHPPAAATVLLITLGGFKPVPKDAAVVVAGILIISLAGELVRQARLIQPGQK